MTYLDRARAMVGIGTPGRQVFLAQRELEAYPLTNCRVINFLRMLIFAGAKVEPRDRPEFVLAVRKATGIPETNAKGEPQGTNADDIIRAAALIVPWVPVQYALVKPNDIFQWVAAQEVAPSLSVHYAELPEHMRRFSPSFLGWHEVSLANARYVHDEWQVLWVDPLGTGDYRGEWVKWSDVSKSVLGGSNGRIFATWIEKGAALSTLVATVRAYAQPAMGAFARGTKLFALDGEAITVAPAGSIIGDGTGHVDQIVLVQQRPQRAPSGQFAHFIDGPVSGKYVRLSDVTLTDPPVVDCDVAVRAATTALEVEIEDKNEAITSALLALQAVAVA